MISIEFERVQNSTQNLFSSKKRKFLLRYIPVQFVVYLTIFVYQVAYLTKIKHINIESHLREVSYKDPFYEIFFGKTENFRKNGCE